MADEPTTVKSEETPTAPTTVDQPADQKPEAPVVPQVEPADPLLDGYYMTNPFFHELANYFGIEQKDFETTKDKLSVIADWAFRESQSKSQEEILLTLRRMENKLQPPEWGERRYQNVYKYIRLASRKQALDQAMKAFEKEQK